MPPYSKSISKPCQAFRCLSCDIHQLPLRCPSPYCLPFSLRPLLCGPTENLLPQPNLLIGPKPCLPMATAKLSSSFNPSYLLSLFLPPTYKARPWFTLSGSLTRRIIPQDSLCARDYVPGAQQCASTEISYSSFYLSRRDQKLQIKSELLRYQCSCPVPGNASAFWMCTSSDIFEDKYWSLLN